MHRTRVATGLVAAISASTALVLGAGTAQATDVEQITDEYLFEISLDEFTQIRAEQPYPDQLDWSSDSCTWSPDEPLGYEFSTSCDRHDFGYRNYKSQSRFNNETQLSVDDNFKADMYSTCGDDGACQNAADVYYWAVRQFGSMSESTGDAVQAARITAHTDASGQVRSYHAVDRAGNTAEFPA